MAQASDGAVKTEMGDEIIFYTPGICTCQKVNLWIVTSKGDIHVGCGGFIP